MSRNLLHKNKLMAFREWLLSKGISHRAARGDYEVLQVMTPKASWQCVFDRHDATEHYTVAKPLESIVRLFIKEQTK